MSKVPHLLKGSALPDGEQRRLAEYASAHPKSALHRKGQHHDAAVLLLVHGIGYQNHGETLAYFGKPVAHSVQTLLALNTDSAALSEGNPAAEVSGRVRVEVIPDGDTLPSAAEVNPLSHHSELTYSLTIEHTEYTLLTLPTRLRKARRLKRTPRRKNPPKPPSPKNLQESVCRKLNFRRLGCPKWSYPRWSYPR